MKLELRHSRIGNTAWNIVRNCDNAELAGVKFSIVTFGNIFKALIRETVINAKDCSIREASVIADREFERLKVCAVYNKEDIIKYVLMFVEAYINSETFRVQVHSNIEYVYRNDIVADYVCDFLKDNYDNFKEDDIVNKENGKLIVPSEYEGNRGYMIALMRSMFLYLYRGKQAAYARKPFKSIRINKVMNDLYIFKSRGYYWQTNGERVDGIDSKLKIPNIRGTEPKAVYDIGDIDYDVLLGAEPESIENMRTLVNITVIKDISFDAYSDLLSENVYDENNIHIRLEYDLGILELISSYIIGVTEGLVCNEDFPVFTSFVESVENYSQKEKML